MSDYDDVVRWTAETTNSKTGNIPTGYIGHDVDSALASCQAVDCPLRPRHAGGDGKCYAWRGTPNLILRRVNAVKTPVDPLRTIDALRGRRRGAKYARLGALGDPAVLARSEVEHIRATAERYGMGLLSYTHGWYDVGHHLRGLVMASTDTPWEADQAVNAGWRASTIVDPDAPHLGLKTPAGRRIVVCPAQRKPGFTCNDCGACDGSKPGPIIGFREHGRKGRA